VRVQTRVRGEKEEARKADEDFFLFLEKKKGGEKECKSRGKEGKSRFPHVKHFFNIERGDWSKNELVTALAPAAHRFGFVCILCSNCSSITPYIIISIGRIAFGDGTRS
jgi:hypothetical protein